MTNKSYTHTGYLVREDRYEAYTLVCRSHSRNSSTASAVETQLAKQYGSQDSMDAANKSYDSVVFDCLKVPPEDFAMQITINDLPIFKAIQPDELTSCAWSSKDKHERAPNIVLFTRKFNEVNFWVQNSILDEENLTRRGEIMSHFIKIAKQLHSLNNLHSLMSILSALQSSSIFRLTRTWSLLPRKDKQTYDKLAELFNEDNNRANLRQHMDTTKLPCIPYLGLYLSDLTYINYAHPYSGGIESDRRRDKMNNVLRVISDLQCSQYNSLTSQEHIQSYLQSMSYIEELQKFLEDDMFKLSLEREPNTPPTGSKDDLSLTSPEGGKSEIQINFNKFVPKHRKTRSLGAAVVGQKKDEDKSLSLPPACSTPQRHLIDDSIVESIPGSVHDSLCSVSKSADVTCLQHADIMFESYDRCRGSTDADGNIFVGVLKKKTILKKGKKSHKFIPSKKYWVEIWGENILYYRSKNSKSVERSDFKTKPSKMKSLEGCNAHCLPSVSDETSFRLSTPDGSVYEFSSNSELTKSDIWVRKIREATGHSLTSRMHGDLIQFA